MTAKAPTIDDETRTLGGAVRILAAEQLDPPSRPPAAESLAAIALLRDAPVEDVWHRGLLCGLRSQEPEVAEAAVQATIDRLARLAAGEQQDGLMAAILDACFLNLSGRPRLLRGAGSEETRRADRQERAAARLVKALARHLGRPDRALEHHRSRLLSRAREIKHLAGRGELAQAVVAFQNELGAGERGQDLVAAEIALRRKLDIYASPEATEATLLAYLGEDRRLPLERVTQELFRSYRLLLAGQKKERARRAILAALDNLIGWLDQTPLSAEAREASFAEVMQRARVKMPRSQLLPAIGRQLDAHLEILPGPDHPEDLFVQLASRYDATGGEDILVRGLELLRRLPLVRLRSGEICAFVLSPARTRRGLAVWQALLALVESLATGLTDFVLTRERLDRREEQRNRALRRFLAHDRELRQLLYRLATDDQLLLSHDAETGAWVRQSAWRTLLRCLPEDRVDLQRQGVFGHGGRFLVATLEESGRAHRRELWEALLSRWEPLFGDAAGQATGPADRRARLRAVTDFFRRTREYTAVQDQGGSLGAMLRLAFDDAEPAAREMAEAALVESGFGQEVERERQRRRLLQLRDELTSSNTRIVELEDQVASLGAQATATQSERVEHGLAVQELLQQRDLLLTESWIFTCGLQVDLEEVRVALVAAIAAADHELTLLRDLESRMRQEHAEAREIHGAIDRLVGEQQRHEAAIAELQRERRDAAASLSGAQSEASGLAGERSRLAGSPPERPSSTGDAESDARARDDYRRACDEHRSELAELAERIERARAECRDCERIIASCEARTAEAQAQVRRLQQEIDRIRGRLAEIRSRIDRLAREFTVRQAAFDAIRREIGRLTARTRELENRQQEHQRQVAGEVAENGGLIGHQQDLLRGIEARLRELAEGLNRTGHQRDQQKTHSQRLIQAIEGGRAELDRIGVRAAVESASADAAGHSLREAHERELLSAQESLVQYVEGLHHAIDGEPPSAVRGRRERHGRRETAGQKTGGAP